MMKKIVLYILVPCMALAMLAGCDRGSYYRNTYQIWVGYDTYPNDPFDYFSKTDSTFFTPAYYIDMVGFFAKMTEEEEFKGGCAYSMGRDTMIYTPRHIPSPLKVHNIHGASQGSLAYMVFCQKDTDMPEHAVTMTIPTESSYCRPTGVLVNNTNLVVNAVRTGFGLAGGPFKEGDWAKLTIRGTLDGKAVGEVSVDLADFKTHRDSVITNWTAVSLSAIEKCNALDFDITSSREDFPRYVCFDTWCFNAHVEY